MGERFYNALKFLALVVLPAISALYFGLGQVWDFPAIEKVVGSIAVLDTVLGGLLTKSSKDWLEKATIAEVVTGIDENGAAEIRSMTQISDTPLMFTDGERVMMKVRYDPTPPTPFTG